MEKLVKAHQRYLQQAAWTQDLRRYILDKVGVREDAKILEIGSGTGAVIGQMNKYSSRIALDIDFEALGFSRNEDGDMLHVNGNGLHLPLASQSMNITFAHYLLLWVPDTKLLLDEMERVTKAGGWVIAFAEPDYGGRINFPQSLDELGLLQAQALEDQGADTNMGRKLAYHFNQTDLEHIQFGVMGFQKELIDHNFSEGEQKMLADDIKHMIPEERLNALLEKEGIAIQKGSRVNFVPTFYAYGQKK